MLKLNFPALPRRTSVFRKYAIPEDFFVGVVTTTRNKNMPLCKNSSYGYYTGKEPSPKGLGYCAHSERVGSLRRGNDGDMWIVQQDKNHRLSWKKVGTPGTPKKKKTPQTPGTPKKRNTPGTSKCRSDQIVNPSTNRCVLKSGKIGRELLSSSGHRDHANIANMGTTSTIKNTATGDVKIRVGEVYTGSFMKSFVELHLSQAFFKTVRKRPKVLRNGEGNAYVFGPLFKKQEYEFRGHHYNDGAQTGIVLMDKNMKLRDVTHLPTWDLVLDTMTASWEDPRVLRMVQKVSYNIVFVGDTDGGDGGADVYIHHNGLTGKIDSIIIDNNYFFERAEDEN